MADGLEREERDGLSITARDSRDFGKWSATVEIEATQRDGYLAVWSSGELDTQVLRDPEFLVLNEHRLVESVAQLGRVWATFIEVVTYADPREAAE
jgi:hypothetical protein